MRGGDEAAGEGDVDDARVALQEEAAALRDGQLGLIRRLIVGVDSAAVAACAHWPVGKAFTARERIGEGAGDSGASVAPSRRAATVLTSQQSFMSALRTEPPQGLLP